MSNANASHNVYVSFGLDQMHFRQDPTNVTGQCGEHFDRTKNKNKKSISLHMWGLREAVRVPGISEQSHIVLGIGTNLCQTDQIDAVLLYVHASRKIVTISLVIAVIKTVKYRTKNKFSVKKKKMFT